jgi:hypothetical protein
VQVDSSLTGSILVENVSLADDEVEGQYKYYRRLAFRRNPNMIQSEALLVKVPSKSHKTVKDGNNITKSTKVKNSNKNELSGFLFCGV